MIGLLVCFGGLLAAGLFFLAADLLRLPYLKTSKAMINTGRENKKAAKSLEIYLLSLAVKLPHSTVARKARNFVIVISL